MELRLSDAFEVPDSECSLELKVLMLNINPGHNQELLDSCKTLADYTQYVAKVRHYVKTLPLEDAVELSIQECIDSDVLANFLRQNKAEAKIVSIYEYDEERHMRCLREEGRTEGLEQGLKQGLEQGLEQGLALAVIELLSTKDAVPEALRASIMEQQNLDVLKEWLLKAAAAQSAEDFSALLKH